MDSLKRRIVNHIESNQPVRRSDLKAEMGISGKAIDREISALKSLGIVHSAPGFGYFRSKDDYESWRKGDGANQLHIRGMKGGISSGAVRRESPGTYPARIAELLSDGIELSAADMAIRLGVTYRQISSAITTMHRHGELKCKGRHGKRIYSLGKAREKSIRRIESVNLIFQECRQSDAMKRVLNFYGVRA